MTRSAASNEMYKEYELIVWYDRTTRLWACEVLNGRGMQMREAEWGIRSDIPRMVEMSKYYIDKGDLPYEDPGDYDPTEPLVYNKPTWDGHGNRLS